PSSHPSGPIVFLDFEITPPSVPRHIQQQQQLAPPTKTVGRIRIQLFQHALPRTCENFRRFCVGEPKAKLGLMASASLATVTGAAGLGDQVVGYKGCIAHRVVGFSTPPPSVVLYFKRLIYK